MNTKLDFDGRVAIVSGAGQGLGRDYAMSMAERGAHVVVNDVSGADAQKTASEILSNGGKAIADAHDVTLDAPSIVQTALDEFGRLDIVVNNAGIMRAALFADQPVDEFWKVFDVSFRGTVELTRAAWPHLVSSGTGRLILVSSSGILGDAGESAYAAAKGAVWAFGNGLAAEGKRVGVQVSTIMPTAWTPMTEAFWADFPEVASAFRDNMGPEHVAAFVAFLAHQDTTVGADFYAVAGGHASRLVVSALPRVSAAESTPEGWAKAASELATDSDVLTPYRSTTEHALDEVIATNPAVEETLRRLNVADFVA